MRSACLAADARFQRCSAWRARGGSPRSADRARRRPRRARAGRRRARCAPRGCRAGARRSARAGAAPRAGGPPRDTRARARAPRAPRDRRRSPWPRGRRASSACTRVVGETAARRQRLDQRRRLLAAVAHQLGDERGHLRLGHLVDDERDRLIDLVGRLEARRAARARCGRAAPRDRAAARRAGIGACRSESRPSARALIASAAAPAHSRSSAWTHARVRRRAPAGDRPNRPRARRRGAATRSASAPRPDPRREHGEPAWRARRRPALLPRGPDRATGRRHVKGPRAPRDIGRLGSDHRDPRGSGSLPYTLRYRYRHDRSISTSISGGEPEPIRRGACSIFARCGSR